jgi:16S rRNA (adenine1518-N6/adenine1519-N6)-dimethyltransferase
VKHQPRKRFGQHFLVDRSVLSAIVAAIGPRPGQVVVEIGPGLGALTEYLLAQLDTLQAVEIDRDLVGRLQKRFGERLVLHTADALVFDFGSLAPVAPVLLEDPSGSALPHRPVRSLRLVGNLPYNISSPLLIHLLGSRDCIIDQHFMLQKEVVDRIAARPATADYGRLTVMMQAFHQVESLLHVPPEAFDPPPRVESAVVRMVPLDEPLTAHRPWLERLLSVAFNQRRKMLRGTLIPWIAQQGVDPERPDFGLVPTARPEEVTVSGYARIADALAGAAPRAGAVPAVAD